MRTKPYAHFLGLGRPSAKAKVPTPQLVVRRRAAKATAQRESFDHLRVAAQSRAADQAPAPKAAASPKPGSAAERAVASYRKAIGGRAEIAR